MEMLQTSHHTCIDTCCTVEELLLWSNLSPPSKGGHVLALIMRLCNPLLCQCV